MTIPLKEIEIIQTKIIGKEEDKIEVEKNIVGITPEMIEEIPIKKGKFTSLMSLNLSIVIGKTTTVEIEGVRMMVATEETVEADLPAVITGIKIQLVAVIVVLISTILAFLLEIIKMYELQTVTLADLLLMFIYIEVIGLVRSYWESRAVRVIYPLVIAITALARYIILQDKESDPANLIYLASAILIISIATVVIRFRRSKYLNIDKDKSNDL